MTEETDKVKRLKEKMKPTFKELDSVVQMELPSMENCEKNEEDANKLRAKADDGAVNVVKNVMKQKEVQKLLKSNINKQTFISGLFMAFLLIGFLQVSTAIKEIINYSWEFDLSAGIILITIGAIYMIKNVLLAKESG